MELGLQTRAQKQVQNDHDIRALSPGELAQAAGLGHRFLTATMRPTQPTYAYNCHGLTFGSRRTQIWDSSEVRRILQEDGYQLVALAAVLPGDIAIYVADDGNIEHSGLVVEVFGETLRLAKVLSKWGSAQEFIHPFNDTPYAKNVEFYRLVR